MIALLLATLLPLVYTLPPYPRGYNQYLAVSENISLSYTVDANTVNIAAAAEIPDTDYIAIGFSPTLSMQGDAIIGMEGNVTAYTLVEHVKPTSVKEANYLTYSSYSYVNGVATMTFSRELTAPGPGDVQLANLSGVLPMVFAVGHDFIQHYWRTAQPVNFAVSPTPFVHSYSPSHEDELMNADGNTSLLANISGRSLFNVMVGPINVNYGFDASRIYISASTATSATNYLAIGFAASPNQMIGADAVIAMSNSVNAYKINGFDSNDILKFPKAAGYLSNPQYLYDSRTGVLTMQFSRQISAVRSGDIALSLSNGKIPMICAIGPVFSYHQSNRWAFNLPVSPNGGVDVNSGPSDALVEFETRLPLFIFLAFAIASFIIHLFPRASIYLHQIYLCGYVSIGECAFWFSGVAALVAYVVLNTQTLSVTALTGSIAFMTLALTLCPISRTSAWVRSFNLPLDRAIHFHIILGVVLIAAVIVHFTLILITFGPSIIRNMAFDSVNPVAGIAAFVAILLMALATLIRRYHWELFYYTHKACALAVVISTLFHAPDYYLFVLIPLALYGVDVLYRFIDGCHAAKLISMEAPADGQVTTLTVEPARKSFRNFEPGSFAYICIPSIGQSWHPFSIASSPSNPVLTFYIKNMGVDTWTGELYELALKRSHTALAPQQVDMENPAQTSSSGSAPIRRLSLTNIARYPRDGDDGALEEPVPIFIYGPYGSLNVDLLHSKVIAMFAGGIGVTPFISIFMDLLEKKKAGKLPSVERVVLFWVTRKNAAVKHQLTLLQKDSEEFPEFAILMFDKTRPEIKEIFDGVVTYGRKASSNRGKHVPSETSILACGPAGFVNAVQQRARKHKFHFHKESFQL